MLLFAWVVLLAVLFKTRAQIVFPNGDPPTFEQLASGFPVLFGSYPFYTLQAFGWQQFANVSGEFVLAQTEEQRQALCEGNLDRFPVQGRMIGFLEQPQLYYSPKVNASSNCALERIIANCREAECGGLALIAVGAYNEADDTFAPASPEQDVFSPDTEWWTCNNCSFYSGRAINFPVGRMLFDAEQTRAYLTWRFFLDAPPSPPAPMQMTGQSGYWLYLGNTYGIFYQVFFSVWLLFLIISAVFWIVVQVKVARQKKVEPPELAVAALSLELFSCIIRFSYVVVSPMWLRTYFPTSVGLFFVAGFDAFSIMASLLIAVYWIKATQLTQRNVSLREGPTLFICIGACLFIFACIFVPSLSRVLLPPSEQELMLLTSAITTGVLHLIVAIFFIVSGIYVQFSLSKGAKYQSKKRISSQQRRMLHFLLLDSVFLILAAIGPFFVVAPWFLTYPGWLATWTIVWLFQCLVSTAQIFVFSVPGYIRGQDPFSISQKSRQETEGTSNAPMSTSGSKSSPRGKFFRSPESLRQASKEDTTMQTINGPTAQSMMEAENSDDIAEQFDNGIIDL